MGRSVLRVVTVLVLTAALAIMAAPAFAGDASGAGSILAGALLGKPAGTCGFVEDETTEHFFVGVVTGTGSIRITGPIARPGEPDSAVTFGPNCTNFGEFCEPGDLTCVLDQ